MGRRMKRRGSRRNRIALLWQRRGQSTQADHRRCTRQGNVACAGAVDYATPRPDPARPPHTIAQSRPSQALSSVTATKEKKPKEREGWRESRVEWVRAMGMRGQLGPSGSSSTLLHWHERFVMQQISKRTDKRCALRRHAASSSRSLESLKSVFGVDVHDECLTEGSRCPP